MDYVGLKIFLLRISRVVDERRVGNVIAAKNVNKEARAS